jgi:hypothetical protein
MWAGSGVGAKVVGILYCSLNEDKTIIAEAPVEIKLDPRDHHADLKEQFDLHQKKKKG